MLRDIDFSFVAKTNREKTRYIKVFGDMNVDVDTLEDLIAKLRKSDKTNLDVLFQYLLDHRVLF